jgi:phenylpropionate dioxygenase-like ring-hydroxylating dioxygenase large terminal subunit
MHRACQPAARATVTACLLKGSGVHMPSVVEPADILDPRHYAAVRRPTEVAETMPPWCYTSQTFFEREREKIFFKCWNCIGHQSRVPNPGSYITFTYVGVPVIVVRGEDGKIRAFVNSCRHRGAELAHDAAGECKFLKCPYHAWAYSLTGELIGTPMFDESDTFKKSDYGLVPIKLELWAGVMWINFDPQSTDLLTYLGDLPERTKAWRTEDMVCVSRVTTPFQTNWKQYFENFSDVYHVPFVHKSSLNFKGSSKREWHNENYLGNYIMHRVWFEGTRNVHGDQKALPEIDLPADGHGTFYPWIYPNGGMAFSIDSVWVIELYPDGPERMTHVRSLLVPKSFTELPDFQSTVRNYVQNLAVITGEDVQILEAQQRSAHSPLYKTGRFARMDKLVHDSELWILDRVIGNAAP